MLCLGLLLFATCGGGSKAQSNATTSPASADTESEEAPETEVVEDLACTPDVDCVAAGGLGASREDIQRYYAMTRLADSGMVSMIYEPISMLTKASQTFYEWVRDSNAAGAQGEDAQLYRCVADQLDYVDDRQELDCWLEHLSRLQPLVDSD